MAGYINQGSGVADTVRGQITASSSGKIKAPDNIIQSVSGARSVYYHYRGEHLRRIELYSQIEGLIAGNPPYDPLELEQNKLSHIANYNDYKAGSLYERGAQAFWNLLNEAEYIAKFILREDDPSTVMHADTMAQHFNDVIRSWPSFQTQVNTLTSQLVMLGISPCIWPDERDWRWRTIELNRFFVQDQALSDIEQLTCVCVETTFTAQHLYEIYEQFKDEPKGDSPWNIDELGRFLLWRANTWVKNDLEIIDMVDLQRRLQNGDLSFDCIFTDNIRIVSMLMKEYDGKISHYMFERFYDHGDFLFFADRQYKHIGEALQIFTASPGVFTIHSNRGLGHKIFSPCQALLQLNCSITDAARWASTPLIKSLSTGSKDFEQIRLWPGVPTNIGTAEFVENTIGTNINQIIGASQFILSNTNYNIANSGDDPGIPDASIGSISPSQARMQSYKEFSILKNNVMHFYSQFDHVIKNMVLKMLNSKKGYPGYEYAKEWKERCLKDGVPPVFFAKATKSESPCYLPRQFKDIKATRVAGDGSTLARIMGLQEILPIVGSFGAKEAREYKRELIKASLGTDYVEVFLGKSDEEEADSAGATIAALENNDMQKGESPLFSRSNDQEAHITVHLALLQNIINALVQQQITPIDADRVFNVAVPHTGQHIQALQGNIFAEGYLAKIKKSWDQIQKFANLNRKNAEEMLKKQIRERQEAEAEQQQVMSDAQRKDFVAQKDVERADYKVSQQVERAKEASQTRAEIQRTTAEKNAENKRLQIQLENQAKRSENIEEKPLPELRSDLDSMTGNTPSPSDIEMIEVPPNV